MSTHALKSIARRSSMLGVAVAVLAVAIFPAASVFADALNPLTERSLLLSSSAPGFQDTDGSGNSNDLPNAIEENYAPAGSGPNGKKTGETFAFNVSTDSTASGKELKAFTLQYCTDAAGKCRSPGDNSGDARNLDRTTPLSGQTLNPEDSSTWNTGRIPNRGDDTATTADFNVNYTSPQEAVGAVKNDFQVFVNDQPTTGWTMTTANVETMTHSDTLTGKQNYIKLVNTAGVEPTTGQEVRIEFYASETKYITNPGSGSFFVKINTYNTTDDTKFVDKIPAETNVNILDGGVTVANVMTDSIHITTKVLETMSFSVGTRNPDTTNVSHGTCQNIDQVNDNRLQLGNQDAEYSLETDTAYDVFSYWRLSSNSSGGATVYYSGNTLANTVGDEIAEIGATADISIPGTEQFGLGFVDAGDDTFHQSFIDKVEEANSRFKYPTLLLQDESAPGEDDAIYLAPEAPYANGEGPINGVFDESDGAKFAFKKSSNTVPEVIAQNNQMVISCATAKMRYIANIGADTPAGVYTTKINYLAAPQY